MRRASTRASARAKSFPIPLFRVFRRLRDRKKWNEHSITPIRKKNEIAALVQRTKRVTRNSYLLATQVLSEGARSVPGFKKDKKQMIANSSRQRNGATSLSSPPMAPAWGVL